MDTELFDILTELFPGISWEQDTTIQKVDAKELLAVCQKLHTDPKTYFDMLSCLSGVDNGPEQNTMEVVFFPVKFFKCVRNA